MTSATSRSTAIPFPPHYFEESGPAFLDADSRCPEDADNWRREQIVRRLLVVREAERAGVELDEHGRRSVEISENKVKNPPPHYDARDVFRLELYALDTRASVYLRTMGGPITAETFTQGYRGLLDADHPAIVNVVILRFETARLPLGADLDAVRRTINGGASFGDVLEAFDAEANDATEGAGWRTLDLLSYHDTDGSELESGDILVSSVAGTELHVAHVQEIKRLSRLRPTFTVNGGKDGVRRIVLREVLEAREEALYRTFREAADVREDGIRVDNDIDCG